MTIVVNIRDLPNDWKEDPQYVYIGRPSEWGNPFPAGDKSKTSRDEAVERFEEWWFAREQDELRGKALKTLYGKKLVCWCVPENCHGYTIARYVNYTYWPKEDISGGTPGR